MDKKYLKPFFIHNYSEELKQRVDEFDENIIKSKKQHEDVIM